MSTKSAFAPMTARIDPSIAAKLPTRPLPRPAESVAPKAEKTVSTKSCEHHKSPIPTVPIVCELWLEVRHLPDKPNCVWAFIPKANAEGVQRLCAALNNACWPVDAALARGDVRAIRWLYSVALLERISFESNRDILRIRRHLVALVLGPGKQGWETVLWCAYTMKDHELTQAIATLPIYGENPAPGPHKVATFEIL
jgi:hypothetical protein